MDTTKYTWKVILIFSLFGCHIAPSGPPIWSEKILILYFYIKILGYLTKRNNPLIKWQRFKTLPNYHAHISAQSFENHFASYGSYAKCTRVWRLIIPGYHHTASSLTGFDIGHLQITASTTRYMHFQSLILKPNGKKWS